MKIDDAIYSRRSVREFSSKKIKWEQILEAVDAAAQAPFAGNHNHMKFIIISKKEVIEKIADYCDQPWIEKTNYLVIVCSDPSQVEKLYDERAKIYSRQQSGAAIQNFLLKITDLGLASCWVGAYSDKLIKKLLNIPEHINLEAILPVGYPKKITKPIRKSKLESIINWENWGTSKKPVRWPFEDGSTKENY